MFAKNEFIGGNAMRHTYFAAALAITIAAMASGTAAAQDTIKIGFVLPMTGGLIARP